MMYLFPSFLAVVSMATTSEPALASVSPKEIIFSPLIAGERYLFFIASLPWSRRAQVAIPD
ncbi:hypothetical protein ES703_47325 [subsurface metagenome]